MSETLSRLSARLHRLGRGNVMACDMEASDLMLLVGVSDDLAAQYVARLVEPYRVAYQDGDDSGHAWGAERLESPTEAALALFNLTLEQLVGELRSDGASLETLDGDLYVEGSTVTVVLVDSQCRLPALLAITRRADDGTEYPLFERTELIPDTQNSRLFAST